VSFAAIALCVASQRQFVNVHFVIDSVRKLLDTPSYKVLCDASITPFKYYHTNNEENFERYFSKKRKIQFHACQIR
jgi:hypothetical protein